MNALIKKEIRLLLPAWIAAMLLVAIILPLLQFFSLNNVPYNPDFLPMPFGLGILFLSLASLGQEFSFKTFSLSLSQPVPRSRIWLVKIAVLAAAFISVLLALFVCYKIYFYLKPVYNIPFPIGVLIVCGCVMFSGGLWATLLLRQMTGAFWFTLLTPLAILVPVGELSDHYHWPGEVGGGVFIAYSIAGFFWARRMFLRAQDTQWTGGEISFPSLRKISERTTISNQPRHWLSALVRKEFQLHQANILIAVIMLGLNLASVVIRKVHPNFENPNTKFILETIWVLWLLMPLLIGSAAVAEERRLGVVESQLCLPVSRRTQLFIKFSVALILSLILGGVIPFVIERARDFNHSIFIVAAIVFFISFYASTVARTTLQAIGLAIVVAVVIYCYEAATAISIYKFGHPFTNELMGLEWLKLHVGSPILLLVLGWLAFWNFKWLHENRKLWRRNFIVVLAAFASIFVLTNAIYFRAWELLTPIEPPHGAARLSNSTEVKFVANQNTIFATLPDGRLSVETLAFDRKENPWTGDFEVLAPGRSKSQFIGGSNWVEVAVDNFQALGVQSNGRLWNLQKNPSEKQSGFKLTQIGTETNWLRAAGDSMGFLLLKKDGSLWIWGTNSYSWRESSSLPRKLKKDLFVPPTCISGDTNWTEVFTSGWPNQKIAYARKKDGSVLELSLYSEKTNWVASLQSTNINSEWRDFVSWGSACSVGVKTNGELWFSWNEWTHNKYIPRGNIQLGQNVKWETTIFENDSIIALRDDGTLWKWSFYQYLSGYPSLVKPIQLENHSDWIALRGTFALAADGSLWVWGEPSDHIWLAPSRRPVFIGNIFQGANSNAE